MVHKELSELLRLKCYACTKLSITVCMPRMDAPSGCVSKRWIIAKLAAECQRTFRSHETMPIVKRSCFVSLVDLICCWRALRFNHAMCICWSRSVVRHISWTNLNGLLAESILKYRDFDLVIGQIFRINALVVQRVPPDILYPVEHILTEYRIRIRMNVYWIYTITLHSINNGKNE